MKGIAETALDWHRAGTGAALATVIETWGSSPRPVGSQLLIDNDFAMVGSVSGGCIEGAVAEEAREVMQTGVAKELEYGVTNEMAWEVGLACGGTIRVYVETVA